MNSKFTDDRMAQSKVLGMGSVVIRVGLVMVRPAVKGTLPAKIKIPGKGTVSIHF